MANSIWIFLLVLAISTCSNQTPVRSPCIGKNPFLSFIQSKNVKILETSIINEDKCGSEWKEYGTCCELDSLITYSINDKKTIREAVSVTKEYTKSTVSQIFDLAEKLTSRKSHKSNLNRTRLFNLDERFVQELEVYFEESRGFSNLKIYQPGPTYDHSLDKCWEYMEKLRSTALCSTCSGRSQVYFLNEKAIVTEESCHELLGVCSRSFGYSLDFMKIMTEVGERLVSASLLIDIGSQFYTKLKTSIKEFSDYMDSQKTVEMAIILKEFIDTRDDRKEKLKMGRFLCNRLIKVSHEPCITVYSKTSLRIGRQKFGEVYSLLLNYFKDYVSVLKVTSRARTQRNNWSISRGPVPRMLQQQNITAIELMNKISSDKVFDGFSSDILVLSSPIKEGMHHSFRDTAPIGYCDHCKAIDFEVGFP